MSTNSLENIQVKFTKRRYQSITPHLVHSDGADCLPTDIVHSGRSGDVVPRGVNLLLLLPGLKPEV